MRYLIALAVMALASSVAVAQSGGAGPPVASRQVAEAVARADRAIEGLQTTLVGRLKDELGKGGPQAAVAVCRDEAQRLTAEIGASHGLVIGRTSDRVRNPINEPRPWAAAYVASWAGTRAADAKPAVFELVGGGVGVLRPIGTIDLCVMCHGPRATVQATIGSVLTASYPDDRATGFSPGDLRGWFWAEVR